MTQVEAPHTSMPLGLLRAMRPRQWSKNVLVLGAPLMSGDIGDPGVLTNALIAVAAFCLAASGVYLVNDARDVDSDRLHPVKRHRPVAAGTVSVPLAYLIGGVLAVAALAVSFASGPALALVIAIYLAINVAYSWGLKHEPVLDIAIVATGFVLRAVAGGVAPGIELSQWFLLSASFGSLFMVAGKRYAEVSLEAGVRRALAGYTPSYLRFVWTMSAGLLIMTYGLWAFEISDQANGSVLSVISMAPFVLAVLRYAVAVDAGMAGEPEEIALRDRVLQALAAIWVLTAAGGVYLGR